MKSHLFVRGTTWARSFYDGSVMERANVIPDSLRESIFGREGVVQSLDGLKHLERKRQFLVALRNPMAFQRIFEEEWESSLEPGTLDIFESSKKVLMKTALRYVGIPVPEEPSKITELAEAAWTMIASFGSKIPMSVPMNRHWKARKARKRLHEFLHPHIEFLLKHNMGDHDMLTPLEILTMGIQNGGGSGNEDMELVMDELINVIRPIVAISLFITYAVLQLRRTPEWRQLVLENNNLNLFVNEVRRYYPFAPILAAKCIHSFEVVDQGTEVHVPKNTILFLDLWASNHDPESFKDPMTFNPLRFREESMAKIMAQGFGDPARGHRCPGEDHTVLAMESAILTLVRRKWGFTETVSPDLDLKHMPSLPKRPLLIRMF